MPKQMVKNGSIPKEMTPEEFYSKGVLIFPKIRKWGGTAKLTEELSAELFGDDVDVLRATQDLMRKEDRDLLEAMGTIKNKALGFIYRNSIATPLENFFFIPKTKEIVEDGEVKMENLIEVVNQGLKMYQGQYFELADEFCEKSEEIEKRFAKAKPKLYRPEKYPSKKEMRRRFMFGWSFEEIAPAKNLPPEMLKQEVENFRGFIQEMKSNTTRAFKVAVIERMQALSNGKKSQATINSINSLMDKFDNLYADFIDDSMLKSMASEIKDYMKGTDAGMLRADDDFSDMVSDMAKKVVKNVKKVEDSGERFLDF
jgi:hypothetical protein